MSKHPLQHLKNKSLAKYGEDNYFIPRIFHRKGQGKKGPRYLIKCGCCEQKLEICYDEDDLEINGVMASIESWKEILEPLLYPNKNIKSEKNAKSNKYRLSHK
jgi:hypothetical protein